MTGLGSRVPVLAVLGAGMLGLGLVIGLVFPGFARLLGIPPQYVDTVTFRAACLAAGVVLAGLNWYLVRCIVGRRLRTLTLRLQQVAAAVLLQTTADAGPGGHVRVPHLETRTDDDLGRASRAVNDLLDALQKERRFRSVVHAGSDVTLFVGSTGTVLFASQSLRDVLGWDAEDAIGVRVHDTVHPDDRHHVDRLLALDGPGPAHGPGVWEGTSQPEQPVTALTARVRTSSGAWRWLEVRISDQRGDPVIAAVVLVGRDVTDRVLLQHQLSYQAHHDPLTGLANRAALQARAGELRAGSPTGRLAVALLDLDGFKDVNDTLGHAMGDQLLAQVGPRLSQQVRADDLLVRLGGDEFAILMVDVSTEEALDLARRACSALLAPFLVGEHGLAVRGSVGVAVRDDVGPAGTAEDVEELMRRADIAMYAAKRRRTGVELFDPASQAHDRSRVTRLPGPRPAPGAAGAAVRAPLPDDSPA